MSWSIKYGSTSPLLTPLLFAPLRMPTRPADVDVPRCIHSVREIFQNQSVSCRYVKSFYLFPARTSTGRNHKAWKNSLLTTHAGKEGKFVHMGFTHYAFQVHILVLLLQQTETKPQYEAEKVPRYLVRLPYMYMHNSYSTHLHHAPRTWHLARYGSPPAQPCLSACARELSLAAWSFWYRSELSRIWFLPLQVPIDALRNWRIDAPTVCARLVLWWQIRRAVFWLEMARESALSSHTCPMYVSMCIRVWAPPAFA